MGRIKSNMLKRAAHLLSSNPCRTHLFESCFACFLLTSITKHDANVNVSTVFAWTISASIPHANGVMRLMSRKRYSDTRNNRDVHLYSSHGGMYKVDRRTYNT